MLNGNWKVTIENYGYGKCNNRGEALQEFALDNDMVSTVMCPL